MNLGSPISSVSPTSHGPVLAVLAGTESWLGPKQVAELLGGSVSRRRVADVLAELVIHGIADREVCGSGNVFRLNRNHLAVPAIVALSNLRNQLIELIRSIVEAWSVPAQAVWLFGSAARGDGGVDSDVDLFIIRPSNIREDDEAWLSQVDGLADRVVGASGNACQVLDPSLDRFHEMVRQDERLIGELRAHALRISGSTVNAMIRGAKAAGRDAP